MTAPVFGNCGNCGAWDRLGHAEWQGKRACARHPPMPLIGDADSYPFTKPSDGCFDWLPKPLAMEKNDS